MSKIAVIVVAAGKSERYGDKEKKIFAKIGNQAVFLRSIHLFVNRDDVAQTILVAAPEDEEQIKKQYGANLGFMGVELAIGGATRTDSVASGLAAVRDDVELIAIHDAARPCTSEAMINNVFAEAQKSGAAILASPVRSTLKRGSDQQVIEETVSRQGLWEAQTPQVFKRQLILDAYDKRAEFSGELTDDAQLVEAMGEAVALVESDFTNLKVTTKGDVPLANLIVKHRPQAKAKSKLGAFEEAQW